MNTLHESSTSARTTKATHATPDAGTHHGGCHCGAVRFSVRLAPGFMATRCNCTICQKTAQIGTIVKPGDLTLVAGEEHLATYAWGGRTATRYFCSRCGIHCFARGSLVELGGAYAAVNLNTLDALDPASLHVLHWDGRHDNWDAGPRPTPYAIG